MMWTSGKFHANLLPDSAGTQGNVLFTWAFCKKPTAPEQTP